ncbi:DUF1510 family protein [Alkalicoccus urumqiensis]|uniref:DUF1510 family protein n=1 Tax=Alkalicoccus urumqiensis TaxID=1548213 RepID=UPI0015E5A9EC|nr:DUF1510 family protein [Alkalicoccus urumqiensis]
MSSRIPQRSDQRKKRKMDTVLNIAIGVVALMIVVVSATLFLGGGGGGETASNQEPAEQETASEENAAEENTNTNTDADTGNISVNTGTAEEEEENESGASENLNMNEPEENEEESTEENNNEAREEENEGNEENDSSANNEENNNEEDADENEENGGVYAMNEDEWEPIGTQQSEPFALDSSKFDRDSVNWEEMERAIAYGAGINAGNMNVYRIENGGTMQSAVGTVQSSDGDPDQPYQVRIEWVENEGWMPVDAEQLNSNPYR